jgi:hypothetical protein
MLLTFLAGLTLAQAPAPSAPSEACIAEQGCVRTSAAQLFALADKLYQDGDLAGAAEVLQVLTQDKHPELRAEARFRLAAVKEKLGDLEGAAQALRELLGEQPDANPARLELARILTLLGRTTEARAELARAEAVGLPPEVEQNVRRFASGLRSARKRGLTVELTVGPDSNVNRSTSSLFVDTIIAPFELDADARQQKALGYSTSLRGYSRDRLGRVNLLSNAALRADLSDKPRFNDIQLALDSGPELIVRRARVRPAALYERRWFGGDLYSSGVGGVVELLAPLGLRTQLGLSGSLVHQRIAKNSGQDGWRSALNADLTHAFASGVTARATLRYAALDAPINPERLRQAGAGLLLAREWQPLTLFGEADYTRTDGIEPLFLFGSTRHDRRWDFIAGVIFNRGRIGGFSPLLRVTHSNSDANIAIYEYRRTRLDIGVTRSF